MKHQKTIKSLHQGPRALCVVIKSHVLVFWLKTINCQNSCQSIFNLWFSYYIAYIVMLYYLQKLVKADRHPVAQHPFHHCL